MVWVELPERFDALQLYGKALAEGITFAPGPIFSTTGGYRNSLRLNAATWTPRVEAAIAHLGAVARATS